MSGYESYDYLDGDLHLPRDPLTPEFDRVPPYDGGHTPAVIERAERLLAATITISLHDHPVRFPADMANTPAYNRAGRQFTAFEGLRASGLTVVFDNMMDGTATVTGNTPWQWEDVVTDLGMRQADIAHQSDVVVIRTLADIHAAHAAGRTGLVFGLEAATPIGNDLDRLDILYGLGIRQIGLAYSQSNGLGAGLSERTDFGLTDFGRAAVRRMNQLGLAIDVSHSSDRTGIDAADASDVPVFITHAGARALWDIPRLKSDDVLRAVAAGGGVIGMSAAPHTTISRDHPTHSLLSVMDHFEYCAELLGIDHVAFGPDTLYGDHVGLHTTFSSMLGATAATTEDHPRVEYVDGLENPTESFHNIAAWLVEHGYSDDEIGKVLGGNVLRVLGEVWAG
ncbi:MULTISPECIES: dipeptidase [unclassified Curtobacterium]|uniref:dipeptidase n=1 Tax=unclassified Curtobacterium TaxID=257496 RepID=UPI0021AC62F9|nr:MULTISPECIES: dipeptidase [unclassified Curtobacterium]